MWHRNPCDGPPEFETVVGFANPGADTVEVVLDVPHELGRSVTHRRSRGLPPPPVRRSGADRGSSSGWRPAGTRWRRSAAASRAFWCGSNCRARSRFMRRSSTARAATRGRSRRSRWPLPRSSASGQGQRRLPPRFDDPGEPEDALAKRDQLEPRRPVLLPLLEVVAGQEHPDPRRSQLRGTLPETRGQRDLRRVTTRPADTRSPSSTPAGN